MIAEGVQWQGRAEQFMSNLLNRRMECLVCHNSQWSMWEDDLGDSAFLFAERSGDAGIWDLEAGLHQGFDALRGTDGPAGATLERNGAEALAWLVIVNTADLVWRETFGYRLMIANHFPRTREQRDKLVALAGAFTASGYSLQALLVAVATDAAFNRVAPADGLEAGAPMAAMFDSFVDDELPVADRRNGVGELVRRRAARILLSSVYSALEWTPPREFPLKFLSDGARLQRQLGVYLKDGDPGFSGASFQSRLAWEDAFAACEPPSTGCDVAVELEADYLTEEGRCQLCSYHASACAATDACCEADWDALCDPECLAYAAELLPWEEPLAPPAMLAGDWLGRMASEAAQLGLTLRETLPALKDRLLADPSVDSEEAALLADVAGISLDAVLSALDDPAAPLRCVCGVLLATPAFQFTGLPLPPVPTDTAWRPTGADYETYCAQVAALVRQLGCP